MMIEDYSMEQLLRRALDGSQNNSIAFCLAKSRIQKPTLISVQLNLELIQNSNDIRWIEVLERQAINNYQLVFHCCQDIILVYPTLLDINNPTDNQNQFAYLQSNLINIINQTSQQQIQQQVVWNAFTALINAYLQKSISSARLQIFMGNFNTILSNQNVVSNFQNWKKSQLLSDQIVDDSIYCVTAFKFVLAAIKLFKRVCDGLRSTMRYLNFASNTKGIKNWLTRNYMQIVALSSELIKAHFDKHYLRTPMPLKIQQDLIDCLIQSQQLPQIQHLILASHAVLLQPLMNNHLIVLQNNGPLYIEDRLNWQYGLIDGYYGEDLPSYLTKLTLALCQCPGFLASYLYHLHLSCTHHAVSEDQAIMKLSIVHKPLSKRKDLTYRLANPLIALFVDNFNFYNSSLQSQMNFCRKLRLLFLFFQFLKESQVNKLMQFLFAMLRHEQHSSFCFKEAYLLVQRLQQIEKTQNLKNRHVSNLVRTVKQQASVIMNELTNIVDSVYVEWPLYEQSQKRQGKLTQIYKLMELVLDSNQAELEDLFPKLTQEFSDWTQRQFEAHWNRGVKQSLLLDLLMRLSKKTIQNIKEEYYIDLTSAIYKTLRLLNYPSSCAYQQQLLQILNFVLDSQKSINSSTCTILLSLKAITQSHEYSIYPIRKILKILCSQKISESILYEWSDLCIFMLNLFLSYLSRYMHGEYTNFYREEWIQMINLFGLFIQIYEQAIGKNEGIRDEIVGLVDRMTDEQIRLQILIVLNFKRNISIKPLCNATNIITFLKYRKTFQLVILYYCNIISNQYDELIMNQLIQCHRIYKEKQLKMDFLPQIVFTDWPYLNVKIEGRTLEVIRRARRQGHIDGFQFNQIVKQLNFN